jgi:hypothetical protein
MSVRQLLAQPEPIVELPYNILPFKVPQNYGVQTYLAQLSASIDLPAGNIDIERTLTFEGQNFNNQQVLLTLTPDPAVDYTGFNPFGIDSWAVGVDDDEIIITFFNGNGVVVNTQVNILVFEVV